MFYHFSLILSFFYFSGKFPLIEGYSTFWRKKTRKSSSIDFFFLQKWFPVIEYLTSISYAGHYVIWFENGFMERVIELYEKYCI